MSVNKTDVRSTKTHVFYAELVNDAQDDGVLEVFWFEPHGTLDTGYTIVFQEKTYTMGDGVAIDTESGLILWTVDTGTFGAGIHKGFILSNSRVRGTYLNEDIELNIDDKNRIL